VRIAILLLLIVSLLVPSSARAADRVVATTLDNGLRVLLLEDPRSPIVSFQVWYRVGSRNEHRGATGIAHFLEHLMFKGTPSHGPKQFARLVEENGGQDNAFTSQDVTSYYVDIAADKLDLIIDLEADRMQNLLLDPKDIASEREVVIEERRTRTEDEPGGFLGEEVSSIAFKAHPYGAPIIGWMEDIRRVTPEEIRAFYKTYYVPNNAIVVAVGAFRTPDVLEKIKKRFGRIPRGKVPPPMLAVEPVQNGERRVTVKKQAELPIVYMAWHVPNQKSDDSVALELLGGLARAKNQIEAAFVYQEDSVHQRASLLARFELIGGYGMKDSFLSKIRALTAADLTRVARTWFPPERKSVGVLLPKP